MIPNIYVSINSLINSRLDLIINS